MADVVSLEQTEAITSEEELIKAEAKKMLKTWSHWQPEKVAGFLATQAPTANDKADLTKVLVEILNGLPDLLDQKKKELIDESCKSSSWTHYTQGSSPKEKMRGKDPAQYYPLLNEEKKRTLPEKIQKQFKVAPAPQPVKISKN